jgi:Rod binding domain-containing protein
MSDPILGAGAGALALPEPAKPKNAAQAARQFEAMLIAQMLRNARGEQDDPTSDTMWDVAAQHFSQLLADNGGMGLAKVITRGLFTDSAHNAPGLRSREGR